MAEQQGSGAFGGYDDEFVDAIEDDWLCPICRLPLKVPVQTRGCGHRFCELCLERHFMRQERDGQQLTCPLDQNVLIRDKDIFPDKAAERKVRSFVIKCPRGCQWTGELRSKEDHDSECRRFPVNCPNCCGELVPREEDMFVDKATERKVRSFVIKCPRGCRWTGELRSKEDHENECKRLPVNCPNGCGELVPREECGEYGHLSVSCKSRDSAQASSSSTAN
ncbi:TNF receptor-associated factor 6-like isoform X4 [Montipora capricornis]|uniref:TNF receptor-associated factor 6-like isoform X4 n=1 Tax=Montipora capricornis TaxID=246305 RepID=UPI0035F2045D